MKYLQHFRHLHVWQLGYRLAEHIPGVSVSVFEANLVVLWVNNLEIDANIAGEVTQEHLKIDIIRKFVKLINRKRILREVISCQ